jgi:TATA-box binding protein (TBP) (component of TFIID and TFIIIB)
MSLEYDKIKVSTKTIIGVSNLGINIQKVFTTMPVDDMNDANVEKEVKIRTIYYGMEKRGMIVSEKKKTKKSFRNAINIIAELPQQKFINFKVSKNGKFQMTGCKSEEHALKIVSHFIQHLITHCKSHITVSKNNSILVFFQTVMTNIDFSIGFKINRQKLDEHMNRDTVYHSLLETSCGYTGVNIKFPLDIKWWDLPVPVLFCPQVLEGVPLQWENSKEPLIKMTEIPMEKKQKKKYNTFLVFHSGNIIMSGMMRETMKQDFDIFIKLLQEWRPHIEEKIFE